MSVYAPRPAADVVHGRDGVTYAVSSFGVEGTTFGPDFRAKAFVDSPRVRELEFRERFFRSTHHDQKLFDFYGRMTRPGGPGSQPMIGGSLPTFYVPLDQRRPNAPYRLPKVIVNAFTGLIFGHGRWPAIRVVGDPQTQDFAEALVKAQRLPTAMIRARNIGGSTGTVGLSWRFWQGKPRVRVHPGKHLFVHEWEDREELIPAHVSEVYQTARDEWTGKAFERNFYWHRRDWTPLVDITFVEQRVTAEDPYWVIDEVARHDDGFAHFVWIQNTPDFDGTEIDGEPDYEGLYENFGGLDVLNSVVMKGATLNLDPTLLLKVDPDIVARGGVRKGSDNALSVGKDGDADYMELAGTSITAGLELKASERAQALEVAQCVSPDPNTIAAAGTSSLALKIVYAPMLGKGDLLRDQYGQGIERLLEQQIKSARRHITPRDETGEKVYEIQTDDAGAETAVEYGLALEPRIVEEPVLDESGNPTGEMTARAEERVPGAGGDVELEWGDYFKPTEEDKSKRATTLNTANGGKPTLSHKSTVEVMAMASGLDPAEEWIAVTAEEAARREAERGMFPDLGGKVTGEAELPPGAAQPTEQDLKIAPEFVLNGAQIQAAVSIVTAVVTGEMPRDAGLGQLQVLFNLTMGQALAIMGTAGVDSQAAPTVDGAPAPDAPPAAGPQGPGDEGASIDMSTSLAAKMTEHRVTRCEHGAPNRCHLCGVERSRDFTPGADGGEPEWLVAWQPIPKR